MTTKECKEWLLRAKKINSEVDSLIKQQEHALTQATGTTEEMGNEKVQTSKRNTSEDRFINYASYSEMIDNRIDELYAIKLEILSAINKVDDTILRTLLILRYLNFSTWEQIAVELNYSYRQVCRLHGKALNKIKDVIECHTA